MESISDPLPARRRAKASPMIDRLPPNDYQMEFGVLGCQLLDPNTCIGEVYQAWRGDVSAHYDVRHQEIQRTLFDMFVERTPIDLFTVQLHLKNRGLLDQVGGVAYLSQLQDVPSAANLSYYLEKVSEHFLLRRALALTTTFAGEIYKHQGGAESLIEKFERDVMALRTMRGQSEVRPINEIVMDAITDIETMFTRQGEISGISTGLPDLDVATDGLHPAEYVLIAAFPSVGKTSLAMNIVEHVTLELNLPVCVFSAEMSAVALVKRKISSVGRVNLREIRKGRMQETDFPKITKAAGRISASKLFIDDTSDMTIQQLRAKARRMVQQHGVKLFVADYAQLFSSPGSENRTNEIDQVSKGFKNMAKELNVPVIVLSQLTEDAKGGVHLKGARALGEDADGYWQLKRPKDAVENPDEDSEPIELWLKKQRNEARGVCINLTFLKPYTRFESASKFSDEDYRKPHND